MGLKPTYDGCIEQTSVERYSPTMISLNQLLGQFGAVLQNTLFPVFREVLGPLDSKKEQLIQTVVLLELERFVDSRRVRWDVLGMIASR